MKQLSLALAHMLGAGVALTVAATAAHAQQPQRVEKIEVTGSNIKKATEEEALPVTVISREDIQKSGAVNVEQLIQYISASQTAGAFTGSQLAGQATYGVSSASLRGLGGSRTLILLNGRRVTPFAQSTSNVDLNSIPIAAIDRIEVLQDGASSVYGSDAIAGVINFITRRDFKGAEVTVEYGEPTRSGGGKVEKYSGTVGFGDLDKDRFNIMLSAAHKKEDALFAKDRNFSATGNVPPFLVSGATPTGRIEGVWVPGAPSSSQLASSSNPFGISGTGYGNPGRDLPGGCEAMLMFPITARPRAGTGQNCNFDSAPFVGLFPEQKTDQVFGTVQFRLSPAATLFAEGLWSRNKVDEQYQPSPIRFAFLQTDTAFAGSGVDQALLIFPNNPNYPHAWLQSHGLAAMDGKPLAVTERTFLTGPRTELDTNTQRRGVLGVRGSLSDWDYEISGFWDKNRSEGTVTNGYFSQLGLARVINTVGNQTGTFWDPWAPGGVQNAALTSALQNILYVGPTATAEMTMKGGEAKMSGTLREMQAGPLAVAAGVSARKESYEIAVPDILLSGDIAGLGGATLPQNGDRTTEGVYAEASIPITRTLEANVSGRIDHYNDLKQDKNPTTGKLSLRWSPMSALVLRGSIGTGFRAPSMGELHQPQSLGTSEQFVDPLFAADGPIQVNSVIGGNPDLKPEKSKQASLGFVWSPIQPLTLRADYWRIKIDNYITTPSALALVNAARAGSFLFQPNEVTFNPDGSVDTVTQLNANAAQANFAGWDFGGSYRQKLPVGTMGLDYNATYMDRADLKTLVGVEHSVGTLLDPDGNPLSLPINGGVIARYKHVASVSWAYAGFGLTFLQKYYTGYRTGDNQVDGKPHFVNSFATYDLLGEYTGFKFVKLALGVKNVFDKDPPLYIPTANYFQFGYDPSLYDPRSRFVYGRITLSFR
ncbi:MAG TPA: TonB-dependent receptor [Usitatibacter sp.]|nr:TonB-dependent receptor [Usitatibacter sp.]